MKKLISDLSTSTKKKNKNKAAEGGAGKGKKGGATTRKKTSRGKDASTATAASVNSGTVKHSKDQQQAGEKEKQLRTSPRRKKNASTMSNATKDSADNDDGTQRSQRRPKKTKETESEDGTQRSIRPKRKPKKENSTEQAAADGYDKQLTAFVKETLKTGVPKLVKDFHEARATAPKDMPKTAFEKNQDKNRYKDVICMDETRVVLKWPADNPNDYIHANWVQVRGEKRYICTQGPTPKTVEDFWRMVFQEKCKGIVMLTEVMELGKKKCEQYWPKAAGETMTSGLCTITNKKVTEVEKMLIQTQLEITANGETLKCEHVLWTGWPDRGVPDNNLATLRLVRKVALLTPCIVHCSAGIGRTGTIVGLDLCQKTLQAGEKADMHEIVKELRKYRHGSVQTDVQFVFMHAVVLKLAENRKAATKEQLKPFLDEYAAYVSSRQ